MSSRFLAATYMNTAYTRFWLGLRKDCQRMAAQFPTFRYTTTAAWPAWQETAPSPHDANSAGFPIVDQGDI